MFKRNAPEKAAVLSSFKDPSVEISRWIEEVSGFDRGVEWSRLFELTRREYLMIERINRNQWNSVLSYMGRAQEFLVTYAKLDTGTVEVCTEAVSESPIFRLEFQGSLGTLYTQNRHVVILKLRAIKRFEEKATFQGKMARWLDEEQEKRRHIPRPAPTRQERFSMHINNLLTSAVGEHAEKDFDVLRTRIFEQNTDRKHALSSALITRLEKPQGRFAAQTVSFVVKYNRDQPLDVSTMGLFWYENGQKCMPFDETGNNPGLGFVDEGTHYRVKIPSGLLEKADIIALVGPFNQA